MFRAGAMRNDDKKTGLILSVCGIVPVIWLALMTAPYVGGGLVEIIRGLPVAMGNPFQITVCEDSVKTVLIFLLAYAMGIGIYFSTRRNYRRREEHGSAKWGDAGTLNKKYRDKDPSANKLLTQNVRIGLDGKKHRRNLNILVCGGSGAGKTRFFCKPNAMQCNTSMVILDPKGEIVRDVGGLLEKKGYEVRVLDLINMHRSHCYNPFVYLRNDNDVQRLVTNLFKATTPKGSQSQDPFWDTAASMLLLALVFYLKYEAPPDEQNFPMVMELLRAGEVREDDDSYVSPLDELFDRLEMVNPEHIALKYYRDYHSGSAKTLKSIQITLAARLEKFNLESLAGLTATDELDLPSLGEKKVALFALIPDNDTSFNFLVSILYTQLFQQLFYLADHKYGGSLPVHCHFIMDEFANVSLPDDFDKILSVMRSRGVSVSIILRFLCIFYFQLNNKRLLRHIFRQADIIFIASGFCYLGLFTRQCLCGGDSYPFGSFNCELSGIGRVEYDHIDLIAFAGIISPILFLPAGIIATIDTFAVFLHPFTDEIGYLFLFRAEVSIGLRAEVDYHISTHGYGVYNTCQYLSRIFHIAQ